LEFQGLDTEDCGFEYGMMTLIGMTDQLPMILSENQCLVVDADKGLKFILHYVPTTVYL
jgi:hypothetical protein